MGCSSNNSLNLSDSTMKTVKFFAYFLALGLVFVCGLYGGPVVKSTYSNIFPTPEYTTGDFSALYKSTNTRIVVFSSSTCPFCKATRELLIKNNVKFTEYFVDRDETKNAEFLSLDGSVVPLIFIENRRIQGFMTETIQSAIKNMNSQK